MKARAAHFLAPAALAAAAAGCIDTDAAVFVDPSITSPTATVAKSALGTQLTVSFTLDLHLGARASGVSRVAVRTFEITSADQATSIVTPLPAETTTPLPVEVAPGSDVRVAFTFDSSEGGGLLPGDAEAALCAEQGIRVTGVIEDSLEDGATPVASDTFRASCP
ncbi:hypothetical protein SOCE26_088760 [Sorangium cellulosum]|uniref:Secreted protein n=1 Tax=Sorangium cellulosum TaxID=56 RepID=A0A2L0F760_SORCE|nr:hypothetical protein [Sorangium cellulosum]AUX47357.1 hypothetical protein SOCE26_088760 [Sorangium cellulosum]